MGVDLGANRDDVRESSPRHQQASSATGPGSLDTLMQNLARRITIPRAVIVAGSILELALIEVLDRARYDDETDRRLLDAAHDQFCLLGIRRSTMEDVARRAGVSRVTVYRRFTNKDRLVEL